jgi:hypothetical protein
MIGIRFPIGVEFVFATMSRTILDPARILSSSSWCSYGRSIKLITYHRLMKTALTLTMVAQEEVEVLDPYDQQQMYPS